MDAVSRRINTRVSDGQYILDRGEKNEHHRSRGVAVMLEKRKKFGPLSLKPHQGKDLNLAHSKYSTWGMKVIFL